MRITNNYILLESLPPEGDFFAPSETATYKVNKCIKNDICQPKDVVILLPGDYPKIKLKGAEYTIVQPEDVLGVLDAA